MLLFSFWPLADTIDIHVHDTYYIIARGHILFGFGCLLLLIWLIYQMAKSKLYSELLTKIHVFITLAAIAILLFLLYLFPQKTFVDLSSIRNHNNLLEAIILLLTLIQIVLPLNIILGLFSRKKNK